MFVVGQLLKDVASGGLHVSKWLLYEFLLLTVNSATASLPAAVCRAAGCVVIVASLRAELQYGLLAEPAAAIVQLGLAALTAVLFGNAAKEFAFDLAARLTVWCGRAFVREGVTVSGRRFWEVQFTDGTWLRCEAASSQLTWEWTEADGCCKRVELRAAA